MIQTVLLTLGRLPKALTLARALKARGCRVIIAEPFGWHLARPSRYIDHCYRTPSPSNDREAYHERLLCIIADEMVDLVIPISEESHHVLALSALLPPWVQLLGPEDALYNRLQDKWAFVQHAQARSLPVPATALGNRPEAWPDDAQPIITKPRRGCSGLGVTVHRSPPQHTLDSDTVVQRFVTGQALCSLSVINDGIAQTTAVYRSRVTTGTVAVCFEAVPAPTAILDWIERFCRDLPYNGFIAFDFIVDDDGVPWGIECNPRLTSGVHFLDSGCLADWILHTARRQAAAVNTDQVITPEPPKRSDVVTSCDVAEPSTLMEPRDPSQWGLDWPPVTGRYQWGYSTLTEAWGALLRKEPKTARALLGELVRARDVVWCLDDPLPFILMTPLSLPILWPAMTQGLSLAEASQRDIAPLFSETPAHNPDQNASRDISPTTRVKPAASDQQGSLGHVSLRATAD